MTRKTQTKRALLLSALSLLMCVSLLVGSTFAWFTDSVTSMNNKIVAGNLKIDLELYKDGQWNSLKNESAPIFGEGSLAADYSLWEPGKTQVAYLRIVNEGTLALKYTVTLDVENVAKDLYKVMKYDIVENASPEAPVTAWNGGDSVIVGRQSVSETVSLDAGVTHYFALAIHMDETAGNEYTEGQVNFDLTVLATQDTVEADAFGSDYDASASFPVVGVATIEENSAEKTIEAGNVSVTVPAGVPSGAYKVVVSNESITTDENEQSTYAADIDLLKDGVKVERNGNTVYLVEIELEADKAIVKVLHKGVEIADYDYDPATGILTFETDSFGPFAVIYEENKTVKVTSTEEFVNALSAVEPGAIIDATGVTLIPVDNLDTTITIPAGVSIVGATFAPNGACWLSIGGGEEGVSFENCSFIGLPLDQFKIVSEECAEVSYTNCSFVGFIMVNSCNNQDVVNTFNSCNFGLTNGFKCGYVNCMDGSSIFNQCTFNYSGGSTMGSNQYLQWNAVNSYSENANTLESDNYTTYVELNGCVRNGCGTYKNTANSTLVVK